MRCFIVAVLLCGVSASAQAQAEGEPAADAQPTAAADDTESSDAEAASDTEASTEDESEAVSTESTEPEQASEAALDEAEGDDPEEDLEEDLDDDLDEDASDEDVPPEREPPSWTGERAAAWVTLLGGLGVAIAGGIVFAVGVDDLNTVENASGGTRWSAVEESYDRAPLLTGLGATLLIVGATTTAVGAALLAVFGEGGTWLEVSALPGGLRLRGAF